MRKKIDLQEGCWSDLIRVALLDLWGFRVFPLVKGVELERTATIMLTKFSLFITTFSVSIIFLGYLRTFMTANHSLHLESSSVRIQVLCGVPLPRVLPYTNLNMALLEFTKAGLHAALAPQELRTWWAAHRHTGRQQRCTEWWSEQKSQLLSVKGMRKTYTSQNCNWTWEALGIKLCHCTNWR